MSTVRSAATSTGPSLGGTTGTVHEHAGSGPSGSATSGALESSVSGGVSPVEPSGAPPVTFPEEPPSFEPDPTPRTPELRPPQPPKTRIAASTVKLGVFENGGTGTIKCS